jgi:trigger factor
MQVKLIPNDHSYERELEVTLDRDEMAHVIDAEKRKLRKQAEIPGFRKGKAPQHLVDRYYGKTLIQDVIDHAVNDYYPKALDEAGLQPVSKGEISDLNYADLGEELTFKVKTAVEPVVELQDYKGLKLSKEVRHYQPQDLDDYLAYLAESKAEVEAITGPVENGHVLVFDAAELDPSGVPLIGKGYNDIRIKVGEGQFDAELEPELIGLQVGDEKVIRKGSGAKAEVFKVTVKHLEKLKLPELDDAFAKTLGDFESMEAYKEKIVESLRQQYISDAESKLNNAMVEAMIELHPLDIPTTMVDSELDMMFYNAQAQGQKIDEQVFRNYYREVAEKTVHWRLIKKAMIVKSNLAVENSAIREHLLSSGWEEGKLDEAMANRYLIEQVENDLLQKQITADILGQAKITEKDVTPEAKDAGKKQKKQEK